MSDSSLANGCPASPAQEFTSVYRMHMLVPDSFTVRGVDGKRQEQILTADTTMAGARAVMVSEFGTVCPGA